MKILFMGDLNFRGWESVESRKGILDDMLPYFHSADYRKNYIWNYTVSV